MKATAVSNYLEITPYWAWARNAGEGAGYSIAVDVAGNSYLAGLLGESTFAKHDASGQVLWEHKAGDIGRGVVVDKMGNSYLLGEFSGTAIFGNSTLSGGGIFLAKYNTSGQVIWARKVGSGNYGNSVAVDGNGNIYIIGEAGPGTYIANTYFPAQADFIAKYSASGQPIWARNLGVTNSFNGYNNLAVDEFGNSYLIGNFRGTVTFGNSTLISNGKDDAFIAKYYPSGQAAWANQIGTTESDSAHSIAIYANEQIYFTGSLGTSSSDFGAGSFIAKYNGAGQMIMYTNGVTASEAIGVDKEGNFYVAGRVAGWNSGGNSSLMISMFTPAGSLIYIEDVMGDSDKKIYGLTVDEAGNIYVTGEFTNLVGWRDGVMVFEGTILTSAPSSSNAFFARLGGGTPHELDPLEVYAGPNQTVYYGYEPAACVTLMASAASGGTPGYKYRWSTGETGPSIQVCPDVTTVYTLTVTDARFRTFTDEVEVKVVDVSCGNNPNNPKVLLCYNPSGKPGKEKTLCVPANAVEAYLAKGATLGSCAGMPVPDKKPSLFSFQVYPNPIIDYLNLEAEFLKYFNNFEAEIIIYDKFGKELSKRMLTIRNGLLTIDIRNICLTSGLYYLKANSQLGSYTFKFIRE